MSETTPVLQSIARMPTGQARITVHYAKCSVYPIMLCKKTRLSVSSSSLKPTQECMFQTQCGILNWCPGRTENPARLGLRGMGWWLLYQDILAIKQIKAIFRLIESSWVVTTCYNWNRLQFWFAPFNHVRPSSSYRNFTSSNYEVQSSGHGN